jgi:protein TonB
MTATTVTPPGWNPIGAPELRANTRRFFTRAFAISGAAHLAVLAGILWLQSRAVETPPTWYERAVDLIPLPPTVYPPVPPAAPPSAHTGTKPPDEGEITPVWDPPTIERAGLVSPIEPGIKTEGKPAPPSTEKSIVVDVDPAEGQFVAFDRAPVPYYQPAPVYPAWPRDAGIEGRVVLHVLVGRDGRVARVTVIRDVKGLTEAAREAIVRWRFHPALSGKNPVAVWVEIPIEFRL